MVIRKKWCSSKNFPFSGSSPLLFGGDKCGYRFLSHGHVCFHRNVPNIFTGRRFVKQPHRCLDPKRKPPILTRKIITRMLKVKHAMQKWPSGSWTIGIINMMLTSWCRFFPTWNYNNQLGSCLVNQQVSSWLKKPPRSFILAVIISTKISRPPTHIHHTFACGRCLCNSGWYNLHTPLGSRDQCNTLGVLSKVTLP